jgi:hypothetical protein
MNKKSERDLKLLKSPEKMRSPERRTKSGVKKRISSINSELHMSKLRS